MSDHADGGIEPGKIHIASSGGKTFNQIEKDAEKVIQKNQSRYVDQLAKDIKSIKALLPKYVEQPGPETLRPLFDCVHNMRGQGSLFDYPLVTVIGGEFCRYIDGLPNDVSPRSDVICQFIDMLQLVQSEKMTGEGSPEMIELTKHMRVMVDKFIGD